jgi:hypothetical protein
VDASKARHLHQQEAVHASEQWCLFECCRCPVVACVPANKSTVSGRHLHSRRNPTCLTRQGRGSPGCFQGTCGCSAVAASGMHVTRTTTICKYMSDTSCQLKDTRCYTTSPSAVRCGVVSITSWTPPACIQHSQAHQNCISTVLHSLQHDKHVWQD